MKHKILAQFTGIFTFLILSICNVHAQFSVKGILVDSLTHESEPYATIRISLDKSPEKPVRMNVTDAKGKFQEKLPQTGNYTLQITSVGKRTVVRRFSITNNQRVADLGTLYTCDDAQMLKGVEVVAQKPLVKAEIDKISYSIEDDPDSKTNTTLEMLRKVPLVTVDGEDNIQVNGSSNFKVHVNGKPNTLMSNNPKEVLRSLPANSVKSIEVITEPGAKYDAEGIGGILNIITTDAKMQGYNVTLGANANNMGLSGYGYGTVQVGKLTLTGNYSYNHQNQPRSLSDSEREDFTSTDYRHLLTQGSSKSTGNFQFGNIEGSYEIDTLNLITFSANVFGGKFDTHGDSRTIMSDNDWKERYSYQTLNRSISQFGNIGINADYQHSFKKKGEYLTLSYKFNNSPNNNEADTDYDEIKDVPFNLLHQYFDNDAHTAEHTAQVDYVNPLNEKHYIDAGMKYIFRENYSDSRYFLENSQGEMEASQDLSSKYQQGQHILVRGRSGTQRDHRYEQSTDYNSRRSAEQTDEVLFRHQRLLAHRKRPAILHPTDALVVGEQVHRQDAQKNGRITHREHIGVRCAEHPDHQHKCNRQVHGFHTGSDLIPILQQQTFHRTFSPFHIKTNSSSMLTGVRVLPAGISSLFTSASAP